MGWQSMDVSPVSPGEIIQFSYEKEIILNAVGASDWVMIPRGVRDISVALYLTGGASGSIETSLDLMRNVKTGSPKFIVWSRGEMWDNIQDSCFTVTAMRVRMIRLGTNGTVTLQMRAT